MKRVWLLIGSLSATALIALVSSRTSWFGAPAFVVKDRIKIGEALHVGDQTTYDLIYRSEGTVNTDAMSVLPQSAPPQQSTALKATAQAVVGSLAGTLVQTVVAHAGEEFEVVATIHPKAVSLRVGSRDGSDELAAVAGKQWRYRTTSRGTVTAIDLPEELGVVGRNFVRALLSANRVSWPEAGDAGASPVRQATKWQTEERGLYGALLASYELVGEPGHPALAKTLSQKAGATSSTPVHVKGGAEITLPLSSCNWTAIAYWQEVTQRSGGHTIAQHREEWAFKLLKAEQQPPAAIARLRQNTPPARGASLSGEEEVDWQRQRRYAGLITSSNLATTLADADAQSAAGSLAQVPSDVIERLKAHLALTREAPGLVAKRLAAAPTGSVPFNLYLAVLAGSSSAASQGILRDEVLARQHDKKGTFAVLGSLALVSEPTPETVKFLSDFSSTSSDQDLRRSSLLAAAVSARTRSAAYPADPAAAGVYAKLASVFKQPTGEFDRDLAIVSLGNLGRDESYELLAPIAKSDESASTRALAVQALRFVRGAKEGAAETTMLAALQHDPTPSVRAAAAAALQYHGLTPSAVRVLQEQLASERSPIALQEILKQISTAAMDNPEAKAALLAFADQCGTHDICHYAQSLALTAGAP